MSRSAGAMGGLGAGLGCSRGARWLALLRLRFVGSVGRGRGRREHHATGAVEKLM